MSADPLEASLAGLLAGASSSGDDYGAVGDASAPDASAEFVWTPLKAAWAVAVFVLAGVAEIGGGWLVWKAVREKEPWWLAALGSLVLVLYGFIPTFQPTDSFGRIYAVYGGFFIFMSYIWGYLFDGFRPDMGDIVGGSLALASVLLILFWPRENE